MLGAACEVCLLLLLVLHARARKNNCLILAGSSQSYDVVWNKQGATSGMRIVLVWFCTFDRDQPWTGVVIRVLIHLLDLVGAARLIAISNRDIHLNQISSERRVVV